MAVSEDALRLLDEVAAADTFDEVQIVVARWRWKHAVSLDPELADQLEGPLDSDGTPISRDQLLAWLGD
jgi:hypothetical protein